MNTVTKVIIAALVAVPLIGGGVVAAKGYHMYKHGQNWMHGDETARQEIVEFVKFRITRELDLNDGQQQKLTSIADQVLKIRDSVPRNQHLEAFSIISGSTFDRAKAAELVNRHTADVQNHAPELIAVLADFYDSLNVDQQQEIRSFITERHLHRMRGMHGGPFGRMQQQE